MTARAIAGGFLSALVAVLLTGSLAGCATETKTVDRAVECVRSGGVWRPTTLSCEIQAGGGGAGGSM